MKFLSES